jgi:DNA-K related protein/Hsp70 protein
MRYVIGIDLGTTNSCVSYIDMESSRMSIQPFRISQHISLGIVNALPTLPSFCYLAAPFEWQAGSLNLPWKNETEFFVGNFAKIQGAKVPTRLVESAKSWLCHSAAHRRDKILPLEAAEADRKISPVEATARYLSHMKEAWNASIAKGDAYLEFEQQEIVLTVPASFDEIARKLTAEAAQMAGIRTLTLLEEPQAAFYSWISYHESEWKKQFQAGDLILVCDVGGGTTDFSLILVIEKNNQLEFQRMAIGEHLLLGGDNMDLSLAQFLEQKIIEKYHIELNSLQWLQLKSQARLAKENLLGVDGKNVFKVILHGTGASVVKDSLSLEVEKEEIQNFLLEGFFGNYSWEDANTLNKTHAIRTMGLPYEAEPSITKHLAAFLKINCVDNPPKFILFNGGTMTPKLFQDSIITSLNHWFPSAQMTTLSSHSLDLAVARGAAYYGKARRGFGVRIAGGAARGYYLEVLTNTSQENNPIALTLLSRGSEEGDTYEPKETFWAIPNTPVKFNLYSSHVRLNDKNGDLIFINPQELQPLPPIETVLRFGKHSSGDLLQEKIPVHIVIKMTAIGTLELWLKSQNSNHLWTLEFQLRTVAGQDNSLGFLNKARKDETFDSSHLKEAEEQLTILFSGQNAIKPGRIMEKFEEVLGFPRQEWPSSILRGLWTPLLKQASNRKISAEHEARWWNLAGFFLRPGFGYPLDDFRAKDLWKIILSDSKTIKSQELQIQLWICIRRIAAGLVKGQQIQIANEIIPSLINKKSNKIEVKSKSDIYQYSEKIRVLASLELLDLPIKIKLGEAILERMRLGEAIIADFWALGRIGARELVYGSLHNIIPKNVCIKWIEVLLEAKKYDLEKLVFTIGQLARKSAHREINVPQAIIEKILEKFSNDVNLSRLKNLLSGENLSQNEKDQVFGDHLPSGLSLSKG